MPNSLIAGLVGYVVVVLVSILLTISTRSRTARIVLALLLMPPSLFCVFGFAATFEPMDAVTQWSFRIGYVVVGVGLFVTSVLLLIRRPTASGSD